MNWIEQVTWWQWVLLALTNSFLGYWAGVGTLYCYHNLRIWVWSEYVAENELQFNFDRTLLFAFLLWPISATYRIMSEKRFKPLIMKNDLPRTYLLYMTISGPAIKLFFMVTGGIVCFVILLLCVVLKTNFLVPKFIKIESE